MRRVLSGLVLGAGLVIALAAPGVASAHGRGHYWRHHHHHHHGWWGPRVVVGVSPYYGWPWYYPPYAPPVVVREPAEVYVERPRPPVEGYWYFCESAGGYYPSVPSCPEPWIKVPPVPE